MLPFCSAAPTPCSPLCPVTAGAWALRRVEAGALRSFPADPLVTQAVPDRSLFSDSAIFSPTPARPTTSCRGCLGRRAARPSLARRGRPAVDARLRRRPGRGRCGRCGHRRCRAAGLMDAEMPTTFPADATGVEESVARFIDKLSKQIFQAEDALTEGYDKLRLSAYDALGAYRKAIRGVAGSLTSSVAATKKQAAGGVPDVSGGFQDKVAGAGAVATDVQLL
ncbi:hypothetical protein VPH35_083104 [Triticum aestivum]